VEGFIKFVLAEKFDSGKPGIFHPIGGGLDILFL
jgi:hypothetical protein